MKLAIILLTFLKINLYAAFTDFRNDFGVHHEPVEHEGFWCFFMAVRLRGVLKTRLYGEALPRFSTP